MNCQLNGIFSIGEDFDDEDLLGSDWPVARPPTIPPRPLGAACVTSTDSGNNTAQSSASPSFEAAPSALRKLSNTRPRPFLLEPKEPHFNEPKRPASTFPPALLTTMHVSPRDATFNQPHASGDSSHLALKTFTPTLRKPLTVAQAVGRQPPRVQPTATVSTPPPIAAPVLPKISSTDYFKSNTDKSSKPLPTSKSDVIQPQLGVSQNPTTNANTLDDFDDWDLDLADLEACERLAGLNPPVKILRPTNSRETEIARTPTTPRLAPMRPITTSSPAPNSLPKTFAKPQQAWRINTPVRPPGGLFETISPGATSSPSSALSHHPLSTPLLTNHLVQLVSASNKASRKRPRSLPRPPMTRRFPGPAGLLPQQPPSENLDEVVVSLPHKPAHDLAESSPKQISSSQCDEEEFSNGPWAAMKAEMGLDERNPACFLRSYSVIMVLRKAAFKQLNKNKVPNMAVMLKSINHTHTDAKAVFKDPTGEIQGTFHRRLLEERLGELKVGAVLLLKQVGVFSPSHRNHYLNVTPKNILRVYSPDGACHAPEQLTPLILEPTSPLPANKPTSCMQLVFEDDDDDGNKVNDGNVQNSGWDEDDLDELLAALPEDTMHQ
ncbi:homologous recombination OB-fold protein [Stigmatopora nigra]